MYSISSHPYTDLYFNYQTILVINQIPAGPLAQYTKQLHINPRRISAFNLQNKSKSCVYALYNTQHELLTVADLADFFSFCQMNGYKIETDLTNMTNKQAQLNPVICYISYI